MGGSRQQTLTNFAKAVGEEGFEVSAVEPDGCLFSWQALKCFCIWLKKWEGKAENICTLSHECLHVTHLTLAFSGVEWTSENDEAVTYHQEFLLRECLKALKVK